MKKIDIEISNRHIHPSLELIEKLFGPGYNLKILKKLSQGDDFAAEETLTLVGPKGSINNVRIIGPVRERTQIEILKSDCYRLGIDVPVRLSGDLESTPGVKIINEINETDLEQGVIIAQRHLHTNPTDAQKLKLKDQQKIKIKIKGDRALIFEEVIVRIKENFQTKLHLDQDEANAANLKPGDQGELV